MCRLSKEFFMSCQYFYEDPQKIKYIYKENHSIPPIHYILLHLYTQCRKKNKLNMRKISGMQENKCEINTSQSKNK